MSILFLAPFVASGGKFVEFANNTLRADEVTNGNDTIGTLDVLTSGIVDWTGDAGGTDEQFDWWDPTNTVTGTWHARMTFISGTNNYFATGSDALSTWIAVSTVPRWRFREAPNGSGGGSSTGVFRLAFSQDGGTTTRHEADMTIICTEPTL